MSFDTVTFWLFFVFAWIVWRYLPFSIARTSTLILSLVFYGWWNPAYLILIFLITLTNYIAAKRIYAIENAKQKKLLLAITIIINVSFLGFFKYGSFIAGNLLSITPAIASSFQSAVQKFVVPVGISFYTFQAMTYSIDTYLGKIKPDQSFRDFFLFVVFYPQLVAGPIVRAGELLPQFEKRVKLTPASIQKGIYLIIWGLFMKIVIADNLAQIVDHTYNMERLTEFSPAAVWLATIYFSVQIFADFAGYSSVAIGIACLLGLEFPENFRYPYISSSLREFWTRWHITLSRWFRDYMYILIGGNKGGLIRTSVNLLATMAVAGLWHGASWTFIAWGVFHGLILILERIFRKKNILNAYDVETNGKIDLKSALGKLLTIPVIFILVLIGWVFFRSHSFTMAWYVLYKMFIGIFTEKLTGPSIQKQYILLLIPVFIMHIGQLLHEWFGIRKNRYVRAVWAAAMLFLLIVLGREEKSVFIYFQF